MVNEIDVSIIIVNYNTPELTSRCLTSLEVAKKQTDKWEVIVVDNGSAEVAAKLKSHPPAGGPMTNKEKIKIYFIKNIENLGFAGGNNVGIKRSKGRYELLLNSDTEVNKDTIAMMVKFMDENSDAGVGTCKILLPNGEMDPACHRGFPTPWAAFTYFLGLEKLFPKSEIFGQYHQGYKNLNVAHEIDCPSGAFFLVRREVIDKVGLLDEDYFMYGEDVDWAYRIKLAGYKIMFSPKVSILHHKKQSGRDNDDPERKKVTQVYFYKTMQLFYKKYYQRKYPPLVTLLINSTLNFLINMSEKGLV